MGKESFGSRPSFRGPVNSNSLLLTAEVMELHGDGRPSLGDPLSRMSFPSGGEFPLPSGTLRRQDSLMQERTLKTPAEQAKERLRAYTHREESRMDLEHDSDIKDLLEGVRKFKKWNIHEQIDDDFEGNGAIGLGKGKVRVPNHNRYPFLFPHDFYLMSKADRDTEEGRALVESGLDKIVTLYERFKIIPNFSALSALNASAAPLFIPAAWEWYQSHPQKESDEVKAKLLYYMEIGAQEHDLNWNNENDTTGAIGTNHHVSAKYRWLRRAGDKDTGDAYQASRELRMDRTMTRFGGAEDAYLAIDMNTILLRNKELLLEAAKKLGVDKFGDRTTAQRGQDAREMRSDINELLYNPEIGNYFDRDHETDTLSTEQTIAAAWTLWGEVPSGDQAMSVIGNLLRLDSGHGLLSTAVEDLPQDVSDEALASIGLRPRNFKAIHRLNQPGNWDGKVWPSELIITTEGILKYIRSDDKGLNPQDRLAITRFTISQIHDQVRTQIEIAKTNNGKFSEKWRPDGKDDNGHYHYEPQKNGVGWGATLAELNVRVFLPELYRLEDELKLMTASSVDTSVAHNTRVEVYAR